MVCLLCAALALNPFMFSCSSHFFLTWGLCSVAYCLSNFRKRFRGHWHTSLVFCFSNSKTVVFTVDSEGHCNHGNQSFVLVHHICGISALFLPPSLRFSLLLVLWRSLNSPPLGRLPGVFYGLNIISISTSCSHGSLV